MLKWLQSRKTTGVDKQAEQQGVCAPCQQKYTELLYPPHPGYPY